MSTKTKSYDPTLPAYDITWEHRRLMVTRVRAKSASDAAAMFPELSARIPTDDRHTTIGVTTRLCEVELVTDLRSDGSTR